MIYNYDVSFETNGERLRKKLPCSNIHQVIKEVRKEHPDARMFVVVSKTPMAGVKAVS